VFQLGSNHRSYGAGASGYSLMLSVYLLLLAFFVVLTSKGEFAGDTSSDLQSGTQGNGNVLSGELGTAQPLSDSGFNKRFAEQLLSELPPEGLKLQYDESRLDVLMPMELIFQRETVRFNTDFENISTLIERGIARLSERQGLHMTAAITAPTTGSGLLDSREKRLRRNQGARLAAHFRKLPPSARFAGVGYIEYAEPVVLFSFTLSDRGR